MKRVRLSASEARGFTQCIGKGFFGSLTAFMSSGPPLSWCWRRRTRSRNGAR
jgi:hypothetical protein